MSSLMSTTTVRKSKGPHLTEAQRAEKRAAQREQMVAAVEALRTSDGWQQWLRARQRFHKYSFGNQLLIARQHPTATRVASFHDWIKLGYCVVKGEKGIAIWAPMPPSRKRMAEWEHGRAAASREAGVELDGARPRTGFRIAYVFAQDQVAPLPPPAVVLPVEIEITRVDGDSLAAAWEPLVALGASIGSRVSTGDTGTAGGYYVPADKSIVVSDASSVNDRVATLVHELAHALVRAEKQPDDQKLTYAQEELVVESVTFSVAGTLGLDTGGYSIPYLASWSTETDVRVIESTAKMINRLASRIEDAALPALDVQA